MCIIVHKPAGVEWDWEQVKECFDRNKHGAGYMVHEDGGYVLIDKGYFEWEDKTGEDGAVVKGIKGALEAVKDQEVVAHFRISTGGGVTTGNCHPYPVVQDEGMLVAPSCIAAIGLVHNGTMDYKGVNGDHAKFSDTALIVRDIIAPAVKAQDAEFFNALLEYIAGESGSRLCIMGNGVVLKYGSGWVEDKGCHYSNTGFRVYKYQGKAWEKSIGKGFQSGGTNTGKGYGRKPGAGYGKEWNYAKYADVDGSGPVNVDTAGMNPDQWKAFYSEHTYIAGRWWKKKVYGSPAYKVGEVFGSAPRRKFIADIDYYDTLVWELVEEWECEMCASAMPIGTKMYDVQAEGNEYLDLCCTCWNLWKEALRRAKKRKLEAEAEIEIVGHDGVEEQMDRLVDDEIQKSIGGMDDDYAEWEAVAKRTTGLLGAGEVVV